MITPKPLFPGARVALLAASSPVPDGKHEAAYQAVRDLGLEPVIYASCTARYGYLAGDDALRAHDLNEAFRDDSIDGILCIRGGYGAHRLLPLLDYDMIQKHPKYLAGYSDVTALAIALNEKCGLVTYHTIMPSTEYYQEVDAYSMSYLRRAMFGKLTGEIRNPEGYPTQTLVGGTASGRICGGNLSLVQQSLGTKWEIDTRGKLLFLEDIHERPYRIDAMLTQLRNAGKIDDCNGILLGFWTDCEAEKPEESLTIEQSFRELLAPAGKPILANLCCGHDMPTFALPIGGEARMDADQGTIELL